jgi:hypothetical protein
MTRLSCHRLRANEVRLWLSVLTYNLGNLRRRLALPRAIGNWSLTSLQQPLVKTGGRVIQHARYCWIAAGGESSYAGAIRGYAGEDRDAAVPCGIRRPHSRVAFDDGL